MQKQHTNNRRFNKNNNRPLQPRPTGCEGTRFINKHQDNSVIFGCFHKRGNRMETLVYNSKTKKHSIWYTAISTQTSWI